MICSKCKKEIDENSKTCSYCGNEISKKKKINKKSIILLTSIIVAVLIVFAIIIGSTGKKANNAKDDKEVKNSAESSWPTEELAFLSEVNTDELFTTLDSGVNEELVGTYAFVTRRLNDITNTYDIIALKKDNTSVIVASEVHQKEADLEDLYYTGGKLYYRFEGTVWSIDLNKGNGNYKSTIEFSNKYAYPIWFYIDGNQLYFLFSRELYSYNIITGEYEEAQTIRFDVNEYSIDINKVYVEDGRYFYFSSEDEEGRKIYRVDVKNPYLLQDIDLTANYTVVDKIGENARPLSYKSFLTAGDVTFDYDYNHNLIIECKNKKYDVKKYRPITLLPNNYLMVEYYNDDSSLSGIIQYINLKTGLVDENYSIDFNDKYNEDIFFIARS